MQDAVCTGIENCQWAWTVEAKMHDTHMALPELSLVLVKRKIIPGFDMHKTKGLEQHSRSWVWKGRRKSSITLRPVFPVVFGGKGWTGPAKWLTPDSISSNFISTEEEKTPQNIIHQYHVIIIFRHGPACVIRTTLAYFRKQNRQIRLDERYTDEIRLICTEYIPVPNFSVLKSNDTWLLNERNFAISQSAKTTELELKAWTLISVSSELGGVCCY